MHKVNRTCPICEQNGKDTQLELRQINLTEAVYICEDRNCIYPIGFQWEYVKNNILDDSDDSSDDTSDKKIFTSTCNNNNNNNKKLMNEPNIKQTHDTKEKINILSNILVEKSEHINPSIVNTKNCIKTNEIIKPNENIRKYNVRTNNKTKGQYVSGGAIPETIVKNAKALSEYFSTATNQSKKPKTKIKTVFDIIQAPVVNKQKKTVDDTLNKAVNEEIISNTSIEHNYSAKENNCDKINSDKFINCFLENALTNPEEKSNNDLTETFDELLFSNEDKCDSRNQNLDLSEMDELLSFL